MMAKSGCASSGQAQVVSGSFRMACHSAWISRSESVQAVMRWKAGEFAAQLLSMIITAPDPPSPLQAMREITLMGRLGGPGGDVPSAFRSRAPLV